MALGDSYASLALLKTRLGITDTNDDVTLTNALAVATQDIEGYCGRQFNLATAPSARIYRPVSTSLCLIDDVANLTGFALATDQSDAGVFGTAWLTSDYETEPRNGIVDGTPGWPFWRLRSVGTKWFYYYPYFDYYSLRRSPVQVTATWGWTTVPSPVVEACLALAEETYKMKDAPFGVMGFDQYGPVRVKQNPKVAMMLERYRRRPVKAG